MPSQELKQLTLVCDVVAVNGSGCVIVIEVVEVQPLASVTNTL